MKQESGRLGVYLGPYSPCGLGPVTVPTWASNEGGELINVYGSFHSNESNMQSILRGCLWLTLSLVTHCCDSWFMCNHSAFRKKFIRSHSWVSNTYRNKTTCTYAEKGVICLDWLWLKKQFQPWIICKLIVPFSVLPPTTEEAHKLLLRQRMQMDSNNILTQIGLDIVLNVRGDDEPKHQCSNLNSSSHFQLPNGHLYLGSLPEPPIQSCPPSHPFPEWVNSTGKTVTIVEASWWVHGGPCTCLLSLCMFEISLIKKLFKKSLPEQ